MKPTPEQLAEARGVLAEFLSHLARFPDSKRAAELAPALQHVLTATEPPTDEELDAESAVLWKLGEADGEAPAMTWEAFRAVYRAGARREGRRA